MLGRLKISFVLVAMATVLAVAGYVYSLWAAEKQNAAEIPFEATSTMIRDLLAFHKKRGSFPNDLKQLEGIVWERTRTREFSLGDRGFTHRNYFYLYTRLDPHRFTLWAVPLGKVRDEAATLFALGTPGIFRTWKGPALPPDLVSGIKADPSEIELGSLGLVEQPKIITKTPLR